MADICSDVVSQDDQPLPDATDAGPSLARRRRVVFHRFRSAAGADEELEKGEKRRRPELDDVWVPRCGTMFVCGRRRDMEDAVSVRPAFVQRLSVVYHFFGVYDGHGCSHVADLCRDRLHELVAEELLKHELCPSSPTALTAVMQRSFARIDSEAAVLRCERKAAPKCDNAGSTAVVAVVGPTQIVVANCGDSRAVLCRGGAPVPLSSDHKPDRQDELYRIEAAGGRVIYWQGARVVGVLAVSRAIGDGYLKPYVTAEPEVTVTERTEEDELLILGSDGLWDVISNQTACDVARMCLRSRPTAASQEGGDQDIGGGRSRDWACSAAATLLTKLALARRSEDNVSVIVVDLSKLRQGRSREVVMNGVA